MNIKRFLRKLAQKNELVPENPPVHPTQEQQIEEPITSYPEQEQQSQPVEAPSNNLGVDTKEYPTLFKPWKKKVGKKWKVLGYYLNIMQVDPSTPEGEELKRLGYKYSRNTFSKPIKTKEDITNLQNELENIGNQFNCIFSNQWLEESRNAFPDESDLFEETERDEAIEKRVEQVLDSHEIDAMRKKEISEQFIRNKIKELGELVDESSRDEFIMKFLTMSPEFHNYSFVNKVLMMLQNPEVSPFVAGAKQWENPNGKFKRKVKEGEKPMKIFAPVKNRIYKKQAQNILEGLKNYLNQGNSPIFKGDLDYLAKAVGAKNYYQRLFLNHIMFRGNNDINSMIKTTEDLLKRFSNYGSIYYGQAKAGGQPLFDTVDVYEIAQTEPTSPDSFEEPSKDFWQSDKNEPDSKAYALMTAAIEWAKDAKYQLGDKWEKGININLDAQTGRAGGWSQGAEIAISEMSLGWRQLSTVIHEIAHSLLHFGPNRKELSGQQKEIEAEATAFIVLNFFGFTETRFAANYLALHKATSKDVDILDRYNKVEYASRNIINGIQKHLKQNKSSRSWYTRSILSSSLRRIVAHYSEPEQKGEGYGGTGQFGTRKIDELTDEYKPLVRKMKSYIKGNDWVNVEKFTQELRDKGYSREVIEKWILNPAMYGQRF